MTETMLPTRLRPQGAARAAVAVAHGRDRQSGSSTSKSARLAGGRTDWAASMAAAVRGFSTSMLSRAIAEIVEFCTRHIWPVLLVSALLTAAGGTYAARHFSINADVTKLIAPDLPWRQRRSEESRVGKECRSRW